MAKRARVQIIKDILSIVKESHRGIKPTPLLRQSNISTTRFAQYYKEILEKEFVKEINVQKRKHIFLTEKGDIFLDKYKTLIKFMQEFNL
jgi:predicted transcriptional regulator